MPDSGYLVNMDRQRAKFNDLLERTFSIHANQITFKFLARRPEEREESILGNSGLPAEAQGQMPFAACDAHFLPLSYQHAWEAVMFVRKSVPLRNTGPACGVERPR